MNAYSGLMSSGINAMTQMGSAFAQKSEGRKIRRDSAKLQREFAQNGLTWKIADAYRNKHLIHPLVSMGSNTISASPSQVGVPDKVTSNFSARDFNIKSNKADSDIKAEQLRGLRIQNDIAEKELNKNGNPSDPINHNTIIKPAEQTKQRVPGIEEGNPALHKYYQSSDGYLHRVLSENASEPLESDMIANMRQQYATVDSWVKALQSSYGSSKKHFDHLRRQILKWRKELPKPRKGMQYVFDVNRGQFKTIPINGQPRIFLHNTLERFIHLGYKISNHPWYKGKNKSRNPNYRRYR